MVGAGGSAETGSIVFNAIHEGFLEVAPSSRMMIGFSVRYYKTTYDNARAIENPYSYGSSYNGIDYIDQKPNGYYDITGLSYTLYMRYFGTRYVAPWGRYFMFGPVINTVKTVYDPTKMNARASSYNNFTGMYQEYLEKNFGATEQTYSGVNLMFGAGRSRLIKNRITLDYGFNSHLGSLITVLFDLSGFTYRNSDISNTSYIEKTVKSRVRGVNRFNVFLKVGILLF